MRLPMVVLLIAIAFEGLAAIVPPVHDYAEPMGLVFFFLYIVLENGGFRKLR